MLAALHTTTHVLPGGRIEIADLNLKEGEQVEVFVVAPAADASSAAPMQVDPNMSVLTFLESLPVRERPPGYWEERERDLQEGRG